MRSKLGQFFGIIFQPFFRWWWALITGMVSIVAFLSTPTSGIVISPTGMLFLILLGFTLLFLAFSILLQGWKLYIEVQRDLEVVSLRRTKELGADWVFVLRGYLRDATGMMLEIRRPLDEVEVPFAIVRVIGTTARGLYQAVPIWISPGHLRDFISCQFSTSELIAYPHIYFEKAREVFK